MGVFRRKDEVLQRSRRGRVVPIGLSTQSIRIDYCRFELNIELAIVSSQRDNIYPLVEADEPVSRGPASAGTRGRA